MSRNSNSLKLALILLSAAAISCALMRELSDRPSEKVRKLHESVPAGMGAAEHDHQIYELASLRIILPEPGQIVLGDADSPPVELNSLDPLLQHLAATTTPDRRGAYLIAAADVPTAEIAAILDKVRGNNINIVKLVTSSRPPDENRGLFSQIPPPDRVIEVTVRKEVMYFKPNPLLLLVTTGPDGHPLLNNEPNEDLDVLTDRLTQIFKQRELNGVFREGTNEVEKTILVDVPREDPSRKYGDLVKLVNAIKLAGSKPIVLGDKDKFIRMPADPRYKDLGKDAIIRLGEPANNPPKVISGGVLNGKAIILPKPPYPAAARAVRASGAVSVQVAVSEEGKVINASAVSGHPLLRPAAVAAARSAQFSPTLLSGKPIKVTGVLTFNFVLPEQ